MDSFLEGGRILIHCGEKLSAQVIAARITQNGGVAVVAHSVEELMDRIGDATPDVLLMDVRLPTVSGLTLVGRIRNLGTAADLPIILTAPEDSSDPRLCVRRALELGATDVIFKPFDETSLVLKLRLLMLLGGSYRSSDERVRRLIATVHPSVESIRALSREALEGGFGGPLSAELAQVFESIRIHCDRLSEEAESHA